MPAPARNRYDRLRPLRRLMAPVEAAQVRWLGRSGLSVAFRTPVLVLETTGRRTGARRRTTLAYHRLDDGSLVVVGGAGGQARTPDWVVNLRHESEAVAIVARRPTAVRAVEVTGPERGELWATLRRRWPRIEAYERRAGRPVPVFRFVPR